MKTNNLNSRLAPFGLTEKDLTKSELAKAKRDMASGTGGFLSSEQLISKSFRKACK